MRRNPTEVRYTTTTIPISSIILDEDIYPRKSIDHCNCGQKGENISKTHPCKSNSKNSPLLPQICRRVIPTREGNVAPFLIKPFPEAGDCAGENSKAQDSERYVLRPEHIQPDPF